MKDKMKKSRFKECSVVISKSSSEGQVGVLSIYTLFNWADTSVVSYFSLAGLLNRPALSQHGFEVAIIVCACRQVGIIVKELV